MKRIKPTLALAAIFAVCGLFLTSCGGGSGSSATTINGISVPPEPDATQNNATLAGVDSNANGVRDDVERKIANATNTGDSQSFSKSLAIAKSYESILTANSIDKNKAVQLTKSLICASSLSGVSAPGLSGYSNENYEGIIFNTPERKSKYSEFTDIDIDPLEIAKQSTDGEVNCD